MHFLRDIGFPHGNQWDGRAAEIFVTNSSYGSNTVEVNFSIWRESQVYSRFLQYIPVKKDSKAEKSYFPGLAKFFRVISE